MFVHAAHMFTDLSQLSSFSFQSVMPTRDEDETIASVYWNDLIMKRIIENVERFKDRNSLELASRRLRELCLKTPITRRKHYAIRFEADPDWPAFLTLLMRPRKFSSRLTVCTTSDSPVDEECRIVTYNFKDLKRNADTFYDGVCKRLLNQVTEFEIKFRRFSLEVLENIERFPKLTRVIVNNARSFSNEIDEESDELVVLDRIQSLELILDNQWCNEIGRMKRLIVPSLKDFCCHVNPSQSKNSWFIEEIMVEMAVHGVQLDRCRLIFPDHQMPRNLIVALTQFMSDRSKVMQVFVSADIVDITPITSKAPALGIQFRDEEDNTMKLLYEACPVIFHKATIVRVSNINEDNCSQLCDILPKMYSVQEFQITSTSVKKDLCPVDQFLISLPSTVRKLNMTSCKLTTCSIDLLVTRGATTIHNLQLADNGSCNTVQNFIKILEGLSELKALTIDMFIPHLLYPKIVEHAKLEKLVGLTNGTPPEKSLQILRQHFDLVQLKKINRQQQNITVAKPLRSHL